MVQRVAMAHGFSMNLLPDWAPNVHPLIVHFPIGLLLAAAGFDSASWALRCNRSLRFAATALYVAGTISLIAAYFTGRAAAETVWLPGMAHAAIMVHWDMAFRAVLFFSAMTVLRLLLLWWQRPAPRPAALAAFALAGLVGAVLIVETADRGAQLVYKHGVGIGRE
jgi:uncharacterized membrane protein